MPSDPHPHHRRSPRLRGYDHTRSGRYFVTLCTKDRLCLFGEVAEGRMHLNDWGRVADEEWRHTTDLRENVRLDAYVVMPNHVHGIIGIVDDPDNDDRRDMARHVPTNGGKRQFGKPVAGSLSAIVGAYKSAVTKRINRMCDTAGTGETVWQPRFYDRVIRNSKEHDRIRQYIAENPACWHEDRLHP